MGSLDGIWPVQRSHKPLPGPGVCLAGVQLDRHEGGIGAGETTLPHRWLPPGSGGVDLQRVLLALSKLGVLADEKQLLGSQYYFQFSDTFPTFVQFGSWRKN